MRTLIKLGRYLAPIPVIASLLLAAVVVGAVQPTTAPAHSLTQHTALRAPLHSRVARSNSDNWSGYATTGATYSDVKGSWIQPAARCATHQTAYSSFWVGIDGDTTTTVEQIGTDADCVNGSAVYYAWYEMYPRFPGNFSNPIRPGARINAEVSINRSGQFVLTISDATRGWSHRVIQALRQARRGSAEWIAEAPSGRNGTLPLANFGTVSFTNCTANGVAISRNPNPDAITMVTNGVTKARTSGLWSSGTAFSVTWKHS